MTLQSPPQLTENEIHAIFIDMRNKGQNGVFQLGAPMISILEWRDRELAKCRKYSDTEDGGRG